jgi:hypothetical protein
MILVLTFQAFAATTPRLTYGLTPGLKFKAS